MVGRLLKRFDPRAKILLLLELVVIFFLKIPLSLLGVYFGLLVLLVILSFGLKKIKAPLLGITPLLILVLVLTPLLNRTGMPIVSLRGQPVITWDGIFLALRLALRFAGITLAFSLFYLSTEEQETILAFRYFGLPFQIALTITISLRYIPYLTGIYNDIKSAHRLRGNYEGGKRIRNRVKIFPILISLMIYAIKRIPTLAMTLEGRGVGRNEKRTAYVHLRSINRAFVDVFLLLVVSGGIILPVIL